MADANAALKGTFHRRQLPPPSVAFSSEEGRRLFAKALEEGYLNAYFRLSETFSTQAHPSFCALGSLSMALNALLVDPNRVWQGVWRWFDESMLDCCQSLDVTRLKGLTLACLACVAHCNSADVTLRYGPSVTEEEFRNDIKRATSKGPDRDDGISSEFTVMIVAYNRQKLGQSGSGHFSPIGAYEEESDRVLIMDVARFKYPPHWVYVKDLYLALQDIDTESNKPRGYVLLKATEEMHNLASCTCANSMFSTMESHPTVPKDIADDDMTVAKAEQTLQALMNMKNTIDSMEHTHFPDNVAPR